MSKSRKRILRIGGISLLVLLGMQLFASFWLGPILAGKLESEIEQASQGLYRVANEGVSLSLINGSLELQNLSITLDSTRQETGKDLPSLRRLHIPSLKVKGLEIYRALRNEQLKLSSLTIRQPRISFVASRIPDSLSLRSLELGTLSELTGGRFKSLEVGALEIKEGQFSYQPPAQAHGHAFEATDIFVRVKKLKLDSAQQILVDQQVIAESVDFGANVQNYSLFTPDSLYEIKVGSLGIASAQAELRAGDLSMKPRWEKLNSLAPLPTLAEVTLPELTLEGLDFFQLYFDHRLQLETLRLTRPQIQLIPGAKEASWFKEDQSLQLRALEKQVERYFKGFAIGEVEVDGANIIQQQSLADSSRLLEVEDLDIVLRGFDLGEGSLGKVLRSRDIRLEAAKYDIELLPETYRLSGQNLWLSTQSRFLLTDSLRLLPGPRAYEAARGGIQGPPDVYEVFLPSFAIEGVDTDQAYFERVLDVNKIYLAAPEIRLTNYPKVKKEDVSALARSDFYDLISDYLRSLAVIDLEIEEGSFFFNRDNAANANAFSAKDITVGVSNFRIDSTTREQANLPFYADDINVNINVEGYSFMLDDSSHQVTIGDIGVSTRDSIIFATAIRFNPTPKSYLIPDSLKGNLYDLYIPRFELQGLDVLELYLGQVLEVDGVQMQEPLLRMHSYPESKRREEAPPFTPERLKSLVASQLNGLGVARFTIEGGTFHHTQHQGGRLTDFFLPDVWLMLEGFQLDSTVQMSEANFLFADAIEARVRGYRQVLKDSMHNLSIGELGFASAGGEVYLDQVRVMPRPDADFHKGSPDRYEAMLPQIRIQGIKPFELYQSRMLNLDSLTIKDPEIRLTNYPQLEKEKLDSLVRGDLFGLISDDLSSLEVKGVKVENGVFHFRDEAKGALQQDFTASDIGIQIQEFRLDSLARKRDNNPFYAEDIGINLNINQYQFMLPDSSYRIQAGEIGISTGGSYVFIDSLQLIPEKIKKQGARVLIPHLQLEGMDLPQLYFDRKAELAAIRIFRPQLQLLRPLKRREKALLPSDRTRLLNPDLYPSLEPWLDHLHVAAVEVHQASLQAENLQGDSLQVPDLNLRLEDFRLDEHSKVRKGRFFFSQHLELTARDFGFPLAEVPYRLQFGALSMSSCHDQLSLDSVRLIPQYGKYEFGEHYGYAIERVEMLLPRVNVRDSKLWDLLVGRRLKARKLELEGMRFRIFRNILLPDTMLVVKRTPQQWLRDFKPYLRIDTLSIQDGQVAYSEHVQGADEPGTFHFRDIKARILNLTNDSFLLAQNDIVSLKAEMQLMENGALSALFRFPLNDTSDGYSYSGVLETWDLQEVNPMAEPAAFVSIKSGQLEKLLFSVNADKYKATGDMRMYYDDLRVSVINRKRGNQKGLESFFANSFVVRAKNPTRRFLRVGEIEYERDPRRSIFRYWYKSLLTGIQSSVGLRKGKYRIRNFFRKK